MKTFKECFLKSLNKVLEEDDDITVLKAILLEVLDKYSANKLLPKDTGLDYPIWIEELPTDKNNKQHSDYRIKVADQNNPNPMQGQSIKFVHKIDDDNIIPNLALKKNSKRKLKTWLMQNEKILKKYMNREINRETMKNYLTKVE